MKPAPFEYYLPKSAQEALNLLAQHSDSGKILAGGQSLVPMMNFRLAQPSALIDINNLVEMDYVRREGGEICIGALARHSFLLRSDLVRELCPLVSDAYENVAHATVRNRGTLCGSLCHADPAGEMPSVALASDATMVLQSTSGVRRIRADTFFQGIYETQARPDELLVEVRIPVVNPGWGHGFREYSIRKGDFALTLVCALAGVEDGRISGLNLVFGGVGDRPTQLASIAEFLVGKTPTMSLFREAAEIAIGELDLTEDFHADAPHRKSLIREFTPEVLAQAIARATNGGCDVRLAK